MQKGRKKFKDTKGGQILGALVKMGIKNLIPGGHILANIQTDNNQPSGTFDRSKSWQDVSIELGKLVIYALALYYLGIELPA